jgi:hypothetical protein
MSIIVNYRMSEERVEGVWDVVHRRDRQAGRVAGHDDLRTVGSAASAEASS